MITSRRKFKDLAKYALAYALLIAFIIGLRLLHHLPINYHYYIVISTIIFTFLIIFSFVEIKHIEKVLPKNSKVSFIVILTFRFLPIAKQKIANIRNNQEMRGARFRGFAQVKNYLSLLIPAVIIALEWADNVSESILMRGGD